MGSNGAISCCDNWVAVEQGNVYVCSPPLYKSYLGGCSAFYSYIAVSLYLLLKCGFCIALLVLIYILSRN